MEYAVPNRAKRENFVKEVEPRVNRIIRALDQISECANPKKFDYTTSDIERMEQALMKGIDQMKSSFAHSKKSDFKLGE